MTLSQRIQELVYHDISGTDILHGEMKNLMLEADQQLLTAQQIEEDNDFSNAMESMDRTYAEGYLDALIAVNNIIIDLTYAIEERTKANG